MRPSTPRNFRTRSSGMPRAAFLSSRTRVVFSLADDRRGRHAHYCVAGSLCLLRGCCFPLRRRRRDLHCPPNVKSVVRTVLSHTVCNIESSKPWLLAFQNSCVFCSRKLSEIGSFLPMTCSPFLPNPPTPSLKLRLCFSATRFVCACVCVCFRFVCACLPICGVRMHAVMWRVTKASVAAQINIPPQVRNELTEIGRCLRSACSHGIKVVTA